MNYDFKKIEEAYYRFQALANNLTYRIQENRVKDKDNEIVTYEVRNNSRVIISNLKSKSDAEYILTELTEGVTNFLNKEYQTFKDSI